MCVIHITVYAFWSTLKHTYKYSLSPFFFTKVNTLVPISGWLDRCQWIIPKYHFILFSSMTFMCAHCVPYI